MPKRTTKNRVQGEGDYVSGRRFQEEERAFVRSGQVEGKAREAADALDGPEAGELERARRVSAAGKSLSKNQHPASATGLDPHVDEMLDEAIEQTFPASDAPAVSPGSD